MHDQLFCKVADRGGSVTWHQDYSYWTYTQPMAHASCFIALDDAAIESGCVQYVPGSHRWTLLPITGAFGEGQGIEGVLSEREKRAFEPVLGDAFHGRHLGRAGRRRLVRFRCRGGRAGPEDQRSQD